MSSDGRVRIGFIPLVDAATLLVAVDLGFTKAEGLDVELVREVSWSNIRDRLAIGQYDAAHLLAPMAVASSLGLSHVKIPMVAVLNLAMNGNAITVSPDLHEKLLSAAEGDLADPAVSSRALKRVIRTREMRGEEPLTFAMTFPFSMHNYQIRYWLAAGGVNPDQDLRLIVLPPPFMVDNLGKGQVDGFCVGAPWNTVAAEAGLGVVLHPSYAIFNPSPEKVLAFRAESVMRDPAPVEALVRACLKAADFVMNEENHEEVAALLSRSDRVGVNGQAILRTLRGGPTVGEEGSRDYLIFGDRQSGRPEPGQASWILAQMLRWRQANLSPEQLGLARTVFDPRHFDQAIGISMQQTYREISAFSGPKFDPMDIRGYVNAFTIGGKI
jgi:NitT/TauT family transport system ATP-binding protein